jgi:glycerol-3-phosphate acyltransferase PlsX
MSRVSDSASAQPAAPSYTIALDVMGSDKGPGELLAGVHMALQQHLPARLIVVGDETLITQALAECGLQAGDNLHVHHASQVIAMEDKPVQGLKKKDASMVRALELVRSGQAQALVSCGNTGSLMAGGTLRLRPMPGVDRPAIGTVIPSYKDHFVLIDAGANPQAQPMHLVHNAILGSHYAQVVLGKPLPRVGLLTIGTEEGKGTELIQQTHEALKQLDGIIHYTGLIEGFQVFDCLVDVVVCDGFVGNILLKTWESLFHNLKGFLKEQLLKNPVRQLGAWLAKGAFMHMKERLSPEGYGGAPFLGLRNLVIKAHGSSNRESLANALRTTAELLQYDLSHHMQTSIQAANQRLGYSAPTSGTPAAMQPDAAHPSHPKSHPSGPLASTPQG